MAIKGISEMTLAKYAVSEENSKGREHDIDKPRDRNEFRRDFTRIIHSEAFRRLQNKTQVYPNHEGDFFRTRMTHSLEVEQISRTVAQKLNLNEDLCAVLAIGHDLGHPPFGHRGQDVLDELMQNYGGFEHNLQAVRLVDFIESPYIEHRGLNLMFETREGLLKHCSRANAEMLGDIAKRHLTGEQPPLEVNVVDICDAVAYVHADLEDAYSMGILSPSKLMEAPGYKEAWLRIKKKHPDLSEPTDNEMLSKSSDVLRANEAKVKTIIRNMLEYSIDDLITHSLKQIQKINPQSVEDVRKCQEPIIVFSKEQYARHKALKEFSRHEIYYHERVDGFRSNQKQIISDLFNAYLKEPELMSGKGLNKNESLHRNIADHISGMTDRYALSEHASLLEKRPDLIFQQSPKPKKMKM